MAGVLRCININLYHSMHQFLPYTSSNTSFKYLMCLLPTSTARSGLHIGISHQSSVLMPYAKMKQLEEDHRVNLGRIEELKEETRKTLGRTLEPIAAMKIIDTLQWLGIAFHYEEEIDFWLEKLSNWDAGEDLHATSLRFRLLRQKAMSVSSDVFRKFMVNNNTKFKTSLDQDKEGLLSLYEASYLGINGDEVLSEAKKYSETQLKLSLEEGELSQDLSRRVSRALELPRHLRMERLETRLSIDEYSKQNNHSSIILEHAKLAYNQVQLLHQTELTEISRWWKQLGLIEKLSFARDRPMECFFWAVGILPDPKYSSVRIEMAKTVAILLVIDDIFDTYGTLDELALFTSAIQRWDLDAIDQLPEYMRICYMALYNTINEIAYKVLKEQGRNVLPFLKRVWIDTIEAFMTEAEWFDNGLRPCAEDYIENGVTTAGAYMALVHAFFLMGEGITTENMKLMAKPYPKLFSNSGKILRLWDDLGTAKEEQDRGDNASSIMLFMKENNGSREGEAREYIMQLIQNLWKDLNMELLADANESLPLSIIRACFNMSRTAQVIYQHEEDSYSSNVDKFVDLVLFKTI